MRGSRTRLPIRAFDDAGLDWQLHRTKTQRLARDIVADALDLEHDRPGWTRAAQKSTEPSLSPIRTSIGFKEAGTSAKIRLS